LGEACSEKRKRDTALEQITEVIRLAPGDAGALYVRATTQFEMKEYDRAIADLDQAIKIDPTLADAHRARGAAWSRKKVHDKAIADFTEAIRLDPRNAEAYNSRAWLLATCADSKFRDGKKAVESATKACEITDWKDAFCVGTLAAAQAEAGDFEAAVKFQTQANSMYSAADDRKAGEARLKLYQKKKPYRELDP
jgi:tetratricopeptide (TPR) repeat protein